MKQLRMTLPNRSTNKHFGRDLRRETQFDVDELRKFVQTNLLELVSNQRAAYDRIMHEITNQSDGLYFFF